MKDVRTVLYFCSKSRIPYKIIPEEEMRRLTKSLHHEGVCFVAKKKKLVDVNAAIDRGVVSTLKTKSLSQPCILLSF